MEQVQAKIEPIFEEFDKLAENNEQFVNICKQNNLRPGHVATGIAGVVVLLGIIIKGYDLVCGLLTCVYPMIASIRAINTQEEDDDKVWLCFWTVFGIFQTVELFFGFILTFIPYYYWLRLAFFVYLMAPQTGGAQQLYYKVFQPLLKAHSEEIKDFISKVENVGGDLAAQGKAQAMSAAKDLTSQENMNKAAQMGLQAQAELNKQTEEAPPARGFGDEKTQ